jgi:hypothetical protein
MLQNSKQAVFEYACNGHFHSFSIYRAGFLFGLFFDAEDGRNMFLRNVGWLSADYAALYPRRHNLIIIAVRTSDSACKVNLKSHENIIYRLICIVVTASVV